MAGTKKIIIKKLKLINIGCREANLSDKEIEPSV